MVFKERVLLQQRVLPLNMLNLRVQNLLLSVISLEGNVEGEGASSVECALFGCGHLESAKTVAYCYCTR